MTIAIIFGIVTFIMGFFEFYGSDGFFGFLGSLLVHLLVTAVMFCIGCGIAALIGIYMPKHWEESRIDLASLKDANGIEGSFFLGTGYIGTEQYYMWYEDIGYGFRPGKVKVDSNCLIVEDSTMQNEGSLTVKTRKMNNKSLSRWLVFDVSLWPDQYKFTIPVGSIKKDFKL